MTSLRSDQGIPPRGPDRARARSQGRTPAARPRRRVDAGPTFRSALAEFLRDGEARSFSPQTLKWYAMIGERFARFHDQYAGTDRLDEVTLPEGWAWILSPREAGLAPMSVVGFVRGIKAIFNWFAADGLVEPNFVRAARPCSRRGELDRER